MMNKKEIDEEIQRCERIERRNHRTEYLNDRFLRLCGSIDYEIDLIGKQLDEFKNEIDKLEKRFEETNNKDDEYELKELKKNYELLMRIYNILMEGHRYGD